MSCLLTQQVSWLQTQEMSSLQSQHMSCLQTSQGVQEGDPWGSIFDNLGRRNRQAGGGRAGGGSGPHFLGKCTNNLESYAIWEPLGIHFRIQRKSGSSNPRFLTCLRSG